MTDGKKVILTILITMLATIMIIAVPFYFLFVKDVEQLEKQNEFLQTKIAEEVESEKSSTDDMNNKLPDGPKLIKKTVSGDELVFGFTNQYDTLISWNNWLFSGDKNYGSEERKAQVWAYNTQTGVKKKIFDLALVDNSTDGSRGGTTQYVNNLQIFDNRLWISLGGYMMPGYIYVIDLEPELINAPVFVGQSLNPSIIKRGDNYIVSGGEGDAGCANYLVQKLDIKALTLSDIYSGTHCLGDGKDMLIGVGEEELYIAKTQERKDDGMSPDVFTELRTLSLNDPDKEIILIPASKMPKDVNQIYIGENYLILLGDKLDYYLIKDSSLIHTKTMDLIKDFYLSKAPQRTDILCADDYIFDLTTLTFSGIDTAVRGTNADPCDWNSYYTSNQQSGSVAGVIEKYKNDGLLSDQFEYLEK